MEPKHNNQHTDRIPSWTMESEPGAVEQGPEASNDDRQFRQRFERKFFILPHKVQLAYALLRQVCRPDPEYPVGRVNSLYFDTPDLEQYERSAAGEFKKDKVRIRWYGDNGNLEKTTPVFLELKSRMGLASRKRRELVSVPSEMLQVGRFGAGIVPRTTLTNTIAKFGYLAEQPLHPIIAISYSRYRLTEIFSGFRVSLDYGIRSTLVARGLVNGESQLPLRGAVIEVKGPSTELPEALRRIKLLDTDWSRFSKYSHCLDAHLASPGTVARLWPSGRLGNP